MQMTPINAIYGARKAAGLDDEVARDLYQRETCKRSLKEMSPREHVLVLQALRRSIGTAGALRRIDGPYGPKLQALWISGWNLGVVRDRRDAAMLSFIERQTGIEHTRFLRDAADARKAVEALKGWLARAAAVDWSRFQEQDAVIAAQGAILHLDDVDAGSGDERDIEAFGAWRRDELDGPGKIAVMRQLGERIRRAK